MAADARPGEAAATPLAADLARRIAADGPVSVADYMAAVLTDSRHGYYTGRDPLGRGGDFVTAPEISQMFGELVGLWCAETWRRLGAPSGIALVELGPGRGTLLADALRAARVAPDFRAALSLHLVEVSPALRARQAEALAEAAPVWHADLAGVPEGPLLLLANEFFDALPVRQFVKQAGGWRERLVGLAEGASEAAPGFAFVLGPRGDDRVPEALQAAAEGSVFEVSPAALELAAGIGRRLAAHGGAALVVDYGHARRAPGETLQAVRRHARHDVLEAPGSADLTCHVDFAALAEAARAAGAEAHGPVDQGVWLGRLGIAARAARLKQGASAAQARDVDAALARLTGPAAMGRLFKALALVPPGFGPPAGFA